MRSFKNLSFSILFGLLSLVFYAQDLPPIDIYSPQTYSAENQNWAISQSQDKTIYFANNKGLLEFNGARWQLYDSPNETNLRSVKVINDRIYTGCYMEFGYWIRNNFGTLTYTSLSQNLDSPLIEDEDFWNIIELDDWILFQSLNRIYIYNSLEESFKILNSETTITKMYEVDGDILFQKIDDGIYRIENGQDVLISDAQEIKSNVIVNIFFHERQYLVQTQDDGFYYLNEGTITPWNIKANEILSDVSVYSSIKLKNGGFAIGTISNGVIQLDTNGEILFQISQNEGLSNNTVLSLYEDLDEKIWLGLDNGINSINVNSPFKFHSDDNGEFGSIYASAVYEGNLYLGTNQGLFYRKLKSNDPFMFIEGTQGQVWCLVKLDGKLFCGHNFGTFIIKRDNAEKIANIQGTWDIKPIEGSPNLLLQGNYNGLNVIEKKNDSWRFRNKIKGFDSSARFFEFLNNQDLFVSHEYKGIFKVGVNQEFTEALEVSLDSIMKGLNSSLTKYNNKLLYTYKEGVFKYDLSEQGFKKDSLLSTLFNEQTFVSGKLVVHEDKLWGFSLNAIHLITTSSLSNTPNIKNITLPHSFRNSVTSYDNITHLYDENYLIGTSSGYIVLDLNKLSEKSCQIALNTIRVGSMNNEFSYVDKTQDQIFANKENNVEISYSLSNFDKFLNPEFQYQLIGLYDEWSDWSKETSQLFKNLPYGSYTFNVRGKIGDNISQNTASFSFQIQRPWLLSNIMIGLYALIIILFSLFMHTIYKRYYKKQREKLILKSQNELELIGLENEQQLMRFKNESLELDIKSKNRELAISTMSLIKKNEFLNSIKEELKNIDSDQSIKSVVKIIDKNLNNTDDWKLFEEAFNNADKDFLKKIKAMHPSLTPNDLRLCAYLRLNLSSKEIAPLLNISPRSVEVKRYRLRKKMNLPHETSLTNYILEI